MPLCTEDVSEFYESVSVGSEDGKSSACSPSSFPGACNEAQLCVCAGCGVWSSLFLNSEQG